MPLAKQVVDFPFLPGVDQNTDAKVLDRAGFVAVENGQFSKQGTIDKRNGYKYIFGGASNVYPKTLLPYNDQLLCVSRGYAAFDGVHAAIDETQDWDAVIGQDPLGTVAPATLRRNVITRGLAAAESCPEVAVTTTGYAVYAWVDTLYGIQGVYVRIVELSTGTAIHFNSSTSVDGITRISGSTGGEYVRVAASGDSVLVVWNYDLGTGAYELTGTVINCPGSGALPTFGLAWNVTDENTTNPESFDVTAITDLLGHHRWAVTYIHTDGTPRLLDIADTLGINDTLLLTPSPAATYPAVHCDGTANIYWGYRDSTSGYFVYNIVTTNGSNVLAVASGPYAGTFALPDAPFAIGPGTDTTTATLAYTYTPASGVVVLNTYTINASGTFTDLGDIARLGLYSKPFRYNYAVYAWCIDFATSAYFLVALIGDGGMAAEYGNVFEAKRSQPAHVTQITGSAVFRVGVEAYPVGNVSALRNADELVATFGDLAGNASLNNTLFVPGGSVAQYDGAQCARNGFLQEPSMYVDTGSGGIQTTGGALGTGQYSYILVYEWIDAVGNVHQSFPGEPLAVTMPTTTTGSVALQLVPPSLFKLGWQDAPQLALYRTEANGSTYYRVWSRDSARLLPALHVGETASTGMITDDVADATIVGHEVLYTQGLTSATDGELSNYPLWGGCKYLIRHKDRLWAAGGELANVIWYSKPATLGYQIGWNPAQYIDVGAEVTGLASMDDTLIVFTSDRVYAVYGDGPDNDGNNGSLAGPILVTTACGCVDANSIVTFDGGVLFLASRGMYMLDRGRSDHFVGQPVQDTTADVSKVIAGTLVQDAGHVRWVLRTSNTYDTVLVYDYTVGKWATWRLYINGDSTTLDAACMYRGAYTVLCNNSVYAETAGYWLDGTYSASPAKGLYGLAVETGWLTFGSVQGFKRLWRAEVLGEGDGAHGLAVIVAREYESTSYDTYAYSRAQMAALTHEQVRIHLTNQQAQAYQFTIAETPVRDTGVADGSYAGLKSLTALSFELGIKGRLDQRRPNT